MMRSTSYVALLATALGASLVAGCAGETQSSTSLFPASVARDAAKSAYSLYIADFDANAIELFSNTSYKKVGAITDGIGGPVDVFLDEQGRLYVANFDGQKVTEYARGKTGAPSFTYSEGMYRPYSVTADSHGNLFEGDSVGTINEYAQGTNKVVAGCTVGGPVFGLAVNSRGDVFVDYFVRPMGPAFVLEYKGGLSASCSAKLVANSLAAGGIALAKNGSLIVAEGTKVAVIDPGGANPAAKIGSGFSSAVDVRLNKANTQAFVTDNGNNNVTVVSCPAGKNLTVLGTGQGLKGPRAAVEWPNAVY
ncbi:MAG TPA: hypothetical protein VGI19_17920 [Candidatus Cybelea sp.]|jgi:hypothetical protein